MGMKSCFLIKRIVFDISVHLEANLIVDLLFFSFYRILLVPVTVAQMVYYSSWSSHRTGCVSLQEINAEKLVAAYM